MLVSGMVATNTPPSPQEDPIPKPIVIVASSTQAAVTRSATITSTSESKTWKQASQNPNAEVQSAVRAYFADIPVMAEVAKCESSFRQFEPNGTIFRGKITPKDVGVMQVNEHYHLSRATKLGYDIHTLKGNLDYSRRLYNESGTGPWVSSSPCWRKSIVAKAVDNTPAILAVNVK